jgi:hypothetical protein
MTRYTVTAWCDRPFTAWVEVEADTPQEALAKAREAIDDAPAEECDQGYHWDEWRVDTEDADGVLCHKHSELRLRGAAPKMLAALLDALPYVEDVLSNPEQMACFKRGVVQGHAEAIRAAIEEATGRQP